MRTKNLTAISFAAAATFAAVPACAKVPEGANPIYASFYSKLKLYDDNHKLIHSCYGDGDCRIVAVRRDEKTGEYEALIDNNTFENFSQVPNNYVPVNPKTIIKEKDLPKDEFRPDGYIACYNGNEIICFVEKPLPGTTQLDISRYARRVHIDELLSSHPYRPAEGVLDGSVLNTRKALVQG